MDNKSSRKQGLYSIIFTNDDDAVEDEFNNENNDKNGNSYNYNHQQTATMLPTTMPPKTTTIEISPEARKIYTKLVKLIMYKINNSRNNRKHKKRKHIKWNTFNSILQRISFFNELFKQVVVLCQDTQYGNKTLLMCLLEVKDGGPPLDILTTLKLEEFAGDVCWMDTNKIIRFCIIVDGKIGILMLFPS